MARFRYSFSPMIVLVFLASSLDVSAAQFNSTSIHLGSTLTTNASKWLSPSGEFAFGFYKVSGNFFLVGIWFEQIQQKTLVWSANRDNPVPLGSTLELAVNGSLFTRDPQGIPQILISNRTASSASLQDGGNFVLKDSKSTVIWQSFDFPTDTVLPGQYLHRGQMLFSNANGTTNYSTGRYQLFMQLDGNLVLSADKFTQSGYWFGNLTDGEFYFNETSMLMYVFNITKQVWYKNFTDPRSLPTPLGDYYHRAMLDDLGNFKQYTYHKVTGQDWKTVFEALSQPCLATALCGEYAICTSPDNLAVACSCPQGFSMLDPSNPFKGCYPDTVAEMCGSRASQLSYDVLEMQNTDYPNDFTAEREQFFNATVDSCKQTVLEDCFSIAAVYQDGVCYTKRMPLLNGRQGGIASGRVAYIKLVNSMPTPPASNGEQALRSGLVAASSVLFFLIVVLSAYIYYTTRWRSWQKVSRGVMDINLRAFAFEELYQATGGFTIPLGQGAYGTVYDGIISSSEDGKPIAIAVKQLKQSSDGRDKEYLTELRTIGRRHHKNLVRLLGFCNDEKHRMLVYEKLKNGSLADYLFKQEKRPSWEQRVEIALGIARGLLYLHEECETQIIHCDIKPQNVLLDDAYTAKISDFGLAKLLKKDQSRTSTNARGTMGYLAPEWLKNAAVTSKVDVYSYGVLLLEIICCRRHMESDRFDDDVKEDYPHITDWVMQGISEGGPESIIEWDMEALVDLERFIRFTNVGLWCVNTEPKSRPTMKAVVQMLEGKKEVDMNFL